MTKFFDAKVELVHYKNVPVQIAADSEAEATKLATDAAILKEPQFSPTGNVDLKLVGESEIEVGSRVFHRLFGPGVVEQITPSAPSGGFVFRIKFDKGETRSIHGPGEILRPEELKDHDPRSLPHYKVVFKWQRAPDGLVVSGRAFNTKERIDPAVYEVLTWCRKQAPGECKPFFELKQQVTLNDDWTGVCHATHVTYEAKLTFTSDDALNRFFFLFAN